MIIVDTGVLLAAANIRDQLHTVCARLINTSPGPLLVPAPVVVETCWMLESRRGSAAEAAFLSSLDTSDFQIVDLIKDDYRQMGHLIHQYADLPLGTVDASVLTIAERLNITTVATLDRRHFTVVRPRHTPTLTLLPHLYE